MERMLGNFKKWMEKLCFSNFPANVRYTKFCSVFE